MKGLNNHTVEEIKKEISNQTGYNISDIKLHGSRITGGFKNDSDLDIVIIDENKADEIDLVYIDVFEFRGEIRFIYDFDYSWLRDYLSI